MPLPSRARSALIRLAQVGVTFALFSFLNAMAVKFEVENGVSILFPATAVSIIACMYFGWWAAIGVVLATIATPWSPEADLPSLFISGVVSAVEGLIPYLVFRWWPNLAKDLRDMRSFLMFLLFGTVLNTAFSSLAGNLLIVKHQPGVWLEWREVFVWWIADFTAALLLAAPLLAFGGGLLARLRRDQPNEPRRSIVNAVQILIVVILLGCGAAYAIRSYLLIKVEAERLEQQQAWSDAEEVLNRMHANFLRAAFIDEKDPQALTRLQDARETNDVYIRQLSALLKSASPDLARELPKISVATQKWFANEEKSLQGKPVALSEESGAHATGRNILALRGLMERANTRAWATFAVKRSRIMFVASLVDGLVFLILVLASATLLLNISRPFAQIRQAIAAMREGQQFDARNIDSRYFEIRSLAETMQEAADALKHREEELRLQTAKAMEASRHKSEFLAKMSHELRTPLNSIIGFSDLLIEQENTIDPDKRAQFLDNVSTSAKHLLELINDLLDIAKVESGKMVMNFEPVDLRQAIHTTVASTAPLFGRKKQEVEVSLPDQPMMVRADRGRVEQVLLNLLSNANKFSPVGETITVSSEPDGDGWRIEVRDHGIGISSEDQQRIFLDFEQVHSAGMHPGGTGLGLALAKRFIEAHGGEIDVQSSLGGGSTFRVRLPAM